MTGYLLDTHVWFWYLVGAAHLSEELRATIDVEQEGCWLSPVSVWELGMLAKRGRVRIHGDFRQWVVGAHERFPLKEAALNLEVALTSQEIDLPHRDPADHFLAATALVYELTLMTVDRRLSQAGWLPTRSA